MYRRQINCTSESEDVEVALESTADASMINADLEVV